MVNRSRVLVLAVVAVLLTSLGVGAGAGVAAPSSSTTTSAGAATATAAGHRATAPRSAARRQATARHRAAARRRAAARKRAAVKRAAAKRAAAKRRKAAKAATTVREIPVTFTVRNTNTSKVPCAADGKTYEVKGHITGPAGRISGSGASAAALYVHGLGYGEFFWNYKGIPGYDYAAEQARANGLVSVTIDRLGYGASGRPDGNEVCYGSEGDYLHQIVDQLRSGRYVTGTSTTGPTFERVALVGHSAGGFMVEAAAFSYRNVDALITVSFSNFPTGLPVYSAFGQTILDCKTAPLPNNYAFFGKTPEDFRAGHFHNTDPAVEDAIVALHAPDPCGDTGGALPSVIIDTLSNNSITVPTLIVNGANDALFPPPDGNLESVLFASNPDLTQVTVPDTGHAVTFGRTAPQFRGVLGSWLKERGF